MGNPVYALNIFKKIIEAEDFSCEALFCNPDKAIGRKKVVTPPLTKQYVLNNKIDIKIYQPTTFKDETLLEEIKAMKLDFIIVAAYGKILPKEFLDISTCINLHGSILPQYRGASPLQESILNMDKKTGITSMLMSEGMDEGDILKVKELSLDGCEDTDYLMDKCGDLAGELILSTIREFKNITPIKQEHDKATYCKKIKKEDGLIELDDAKRIFAKYRAFKSWPNISLSNGTKLTAIELNEEGSQNTAGEILDIRKDSLILGCNKGTLKVQKIQKPSKKEISAVEFARGERLKVGSNIL